MVVKSKISKSKRNNQKRNKLVKQGVIKKGIGNKKAKRGNAQQPVIKNVPKPAEESEESDHGEDMLEMVDEDDLDFLKSAIANRSYSILNRVRYNGGKTAQKAKKRKSDEDEQLENDYESKSDVNDKQIKPLLPIKTKKGIITQEIEEEIQSEPENKEIVAETEKSEEKVEDEEGEEELEEYSFVESGIDLSKPVSTAQLLATRNELLRQRKIHIGTLSAGVLENPEEKVTNLRTLLSLMDEETPEVYLTVRKLATVSLLEIFKDVLPSYEIKNFNTEGVKLKKDTLKLKKYEDSLLLYYKKYLQKLEKFCFILVKKMGDTRKRSQEEIKLAQLSIRAMCELLATHPYFNFSQNIAQVIVPFLNNSNKNVREIVRDSIKTVFKEDKKEEITLKILRIANQYLKNHSHNINPEILEILLVLNLREVNLDFEKEKDIKEKKLKAKKGNILQLSKKERKRKKKLQELEKEMLETKAEENRQVKQKNLTEITKIVFNIYFRILKTSENSKILSVCLEGLAKYAHCINLEYYVDIVNVLDKLLKEDWLGYKEKLHCIQTVFSILGGQGEALNLDPTRFYNNLYKDLLVTDAGQSYNNFPIVLKAINEAVVKRRKKLTSKRTVAFVKRMATLSLQLLHNGSLSCLAVIKNLMQVNRSLDILLDLDNSVGDGKFLPLVEEPEYANAASTALYELVLLSNHYHPIVAKYARHIANGVPASGEGSLPSEFGKCTPEQLYSDFSMDEMAFNPSVPPPKTTTSKKRPKRHVFQDSEFENYCKHVIKKRKISNGSNVNFWISCNLKR